jgi:flavin reductase (DIM6/NTAB) family NADH-FMN oxidoreductase RutF
MTIKIVAQEGLFAVNLPDNIVRDDMPDTFDTRGDAINWVLANYPSAVIEHVHADYELK